MPLGVDPWERKANPLFSPCPDRQGNPSFKRPLEVGGHERGINSNTNANTVPTVATFAQTGTIGAKPCKQGLTRVGHLAWIKDCGLPESTRRLHKVEGELKGCKEEIELLDVQILAI